MQTTPPIEFSYKVTETFYAGEYPFAKLEAAGLKKLQRLLDFGIKHFIDLTEPADKLTAYKKHLSEGCKYTRFPTVDVTVPDFNDLMTIHEIVSQSEEKVYVHCKGGYDRTGVVVATYFIYAKQSIAQAKEQYIRTVPNKIRNRYLPATPLIETNWKVLELYQKWLADTPHRMRIKLAFEPEYLIEGAICPYCKLPALGIVATDDDPAESQYTFSCVNAECVVNLMSQSPQEVEGLVRQALGVVPPIKQEDTKLKNQILGGILGLAVADALGVPVEFQNRESLRSNPVTGMQGDGIHNQPPGTWSDDTSLTLCLLDSLAKKGFDSQGEYEYCPQPYYADIMQRFVMWMDKGEYTAHNEVFDIGIATRNALQRFRKGTAPLECGGASEQDNGNGSLMRILPMALYFPAIDRLYHGGGPSSCREIYAFLEPYIHNISSLTHAHKRSQIACGLYATIVRLLLDKSYLKEMSIYDGLRYEDYPEMDLKCAIHSGLKEGKALYEFLESDDNKYAKELKHFKRLFQKNFSKLPEEEIRSTGYVVDTLEAALWCLLNTDNYKDCVLKAVNLGGDTDTVAAVAGGLAGMFYGVEAIPKDWLDQLARRDYIEKLCEDFYRSLHSKE